MLSQHKVQPCPRTTRQFSPTDPLGDACSTAQSPTGLTPPAASAPPAPVSTLASPSRLSLTLSGKHAPLSPRRCFHCGGEAVEPLHQGSKLEVHYPKIWKRHSFIITMNRFVFHKLD